MFKYKINIDKIKEFIKIHNLKCDFICLKNACSITSDNHEIINFLELNIT